MDQQAVEDVKPMLVVLGEDATGKPRASRFTPADSEQAVLAARLMDLHAISVADAELQRIATELPIGKIFATGRGLVPLVKRDLYDKLAVLLGSEAEVTAATSPATAINPGGDEASNQTSTAPAISDETAPADAWDSIRIGTTVLAKSAEAEEGWFEAVVSSIAADGNELTLRWRDFGREPVFKRKRRAVGVVAPVK